MKIYIKLLFFLFIKLAMTYNFNKSKVIELYNVESKRELYRKNNNKYQLLNTQNIDIYDTDYNELAKLLLFLDNDNDDYFDENNNDDQFDYYKIKLNYNIDCYEYDELCVLNYIEIELF